MNNVNYKYIINYIEDLYRHFGLESSLDSMVSKIDKTCELIGRHLISGANIDLIVPSISSGGYSLSKFYELCKQSESNIPGYLVYHFLHDLHDDIKWQIINTRTNVNIQLLDGSIHAVDVNEVVNDFVSIVDYMDKPMSIDNIATGDIKFVRMNEVYSVKALGGEKVARYMVDNDYDETLFRLVTGRLMATIGDLQRPNVSMVCSRSQLINNLIDKLGRLKFVRGIQDEGNEADAKAENKLLVDIGLKSRKYSIDKIETRHIEKLTDDLKNMGMHVELMDIYTYMIMGMSLTEAASLSHLESIKYFEDTPDSVDDLFKYAIELSCTDAITSYRRSTLGVMLKNYITAKANGVVITKEEIGAMAEHIKPLILPYVGRSKTGEVLKTGWRKIKI